MYPSIFEERCLAGLPLEEDDEFVGRVDLFNMEVDAKESGGKAFDLMYLSIFEDRSRLSL